jgi:hypothetical protein
MSNEEILAKRVAELEAVNALLRKQAGPKDGFKVSEKGALSIYGLGRFPVTLYPEQMLKLLDKNDAIREFIKDNWDKFSHKTPTTSTTSAS